MRARYDRTKSDRWIHERMVKHRGAQGDNERTLIRQQLDNGYGDGGDRHTIYFLQGSPIKAYAVRVENRISFYEQNGKRWGIYQLNGRPPVKHEISERNQDLLPGDDR